MKVFGLMIGYLVVSLGAMINFRYERGVCLTAKKSNCTKDDKPVSVKTQNNMFYYCNECKAC